MSTNTRPCLHLGLTFSERGQGGKRFRYAVIDAQPYVRRSDGVQSTVFTLESRCGSCGRPFLTKCGQGTRNLPRTCRYCLDKAKIEQRQQHRLAVQARLRRGGSAR